MRTSISCKSAAVAIAAAMLLAGCVSAPAPVVNHSFGPGQPPPSVAAPGSTPAPATSAAQTFGLGHANGTLSPEGYVVAPGDTLYSIAFAHGLDFRALAARNAIPPPYLIHPGQLLKLDTAPAPTAAPIATAPAATAPGAATQPAAPVFGPVTTTAEPGTPAEPATAPAPAVVAAPPPTAPNPPPAATPSAQPAPTATPVVAPPPGATRNVAGIAWRWPASGELISGFSAGVGGDGAGIDIAGKVGDPVRAAASGTVVYSGNGLIGYGELIIVKHNDTYLSAYGHNSRRLVKEGEHVDAGQEIALMGASGAPRVELHFEIRKNGKPVDPMGYLPQR